jgi:arylsulfatase
VYPFTVPIDSVTFAFGAHEQPTGMERLKLATRMD